MIWVRVAKGTWDPSAPPHLVCPQHTSSCTKGPEDLLSGGVTAWGPGQFWRLSHHFLLTEQGGIQTCSGEEPVTRDVGVPCGHLACDTG